MWSFTLDIMYNQIEYGAESEAYFDELNMKIEEAERILVEIKNLKIIPRKE